MTLLPAPNQHIGGTVDGPRYPGDGYCANPFCGYPPTERHHIVRRSHTGRGKDAWWVELWGKPWPNVVGLCNECHRQVTINRARIAALKDAGRYVWHDHDRTSDFLDPHPPLWADLTGEGDDIGGNDAAPPEPDVVINPSPVSSLAKELVAENLSALEALADTPSHKGLQDINFGHEGSPTAGSKCPTCNRKVPHPKKATSPESVTWSVRMPADVKDEFKEIVEAAAAHLGCGDEKYAPYKTVLSALVAVLQLPKPDGRAA